MSSEPKTLFEKVWEQHVVVEPKGEPTLLYIDLQLVHEVTSPQAFEGLRLAGRKVRRPDRTIATVDQHVPTTTEGRTAQPRTHTPQGKTNPHQNKQRPPPHRRSDCSNADRHAAQELRGFWR